MTTDATPTDEAAFMSNAHERLLAHYDIDRWHWTDATTPFEVCAGAILVQHTGWVNVEKALLNLRTAGVESLEALALTSEDELAVIVRPVGTPLTKARRLKAFAELALGNGGFEGFFAMPASKLRPLLLATPGIGPETADVILLYGARAPVIVHDAYTARLMRRLGLGPERDTYESWQSWLDARLPKDGAYRRRHHAAIVVHCKETCRTRPKCHVCPLAAVCAFRNTVAAGVPLTRGPGCIGEQVPR
jgi:endonuclease-3 related protein